MTTETIQGTRSNDPRRLAALILGGLLAAGALALLLVVVVISPSSETKATDAESGPATVENDRVILTEEASERLGIETGAITEEVGLTHGEPGCDSAPFRAAVGKAGEPREIGLW